MNDSVVLFKNYISEGSSNEDLLEKLIKHSGSRIIFNINDIRKYNMNLALDLISDPINMIPYIEEMIYELSKNSLRFGIRGSFGEYKLTPRSINSYFLGKLICLEGIVTSSSVCRPKVIKSVHYNMSKNHFVQKEYRDSTMITKLPITNTVYPTRDSDGSILNTEYGLSEYIDYQTINLQEMPEDAPCGQLPRSVECILSYDLVDCVKPGDRIRIYGIYKSLCFATNEFPNKFRNILIANNVESIKNSEESIEISETKVNINNVTKYIAPSIWGHDKIKKALALQLVGGNELIMKNGSKIRGDINILLIGDPSTAKSQLLRFIYKFNDISVATTGKGSSGVGLTAAVVMDKDTGDKRLEAGAMVLADRGIVCIDEFDKMNDIDRVAIHEVMEQQTVTISKAGIHTTLNARCSVLAAANPIYGIYKLGKKPSENIKLPETILTRFDLIFIVLDKGDMNIDRLISEHVVKMHSQFVEDVEIRDGLKEYINKCRQMRPVLSREASRLIIEEYTNLRQMKNNKEQVVSITPRMLETMIRLSTAHAKLRLSEVTEVEDVQEILEMLHSSLKQEVIKNPKRIKISDEFMEENVDIQEDIALLENEKAKEDYVINLLYEIKLENEDIKSITLDEIYNRMNFNLEISKEEIDKVLEDLSSQDIIFYEEGKVIFLN